MRLTKQQSAVLVGTILGDGFLQKTGEKNARLRLEHGEKQKEYILWKGKIFGKLFQGKPFQMRRLHPKSKRVYGYWRWQSSAAPVLGEWRKYFYPNGKKIIPANIKKFLADPIALAVWYMDDGYYYKRDYSSYIYLGRVSRAEADIVSDAISKNFGLYPKVYDKKNKGFALFFGVVETKKLHNLIQPFIHQSLSYKLIQSS